MIDQFKSGIINICVARKVKVGLRNSPAHIIGMACVFRLDLDQITQIQLKRQLVSPYFNQMAPLSLRSCRIRLNPGINKQVNKHVCESNFLSA